MNNKKNKDQKASPLGSLGGAWRNSYTWVLLANAAYILVFYVLMKIFS